MRYSQKGSVLTIQLERGEPHSLFESAMRQLRMHFRSTSFQLQSGLTPGRNRRQIRLEFPDPEAAEIAQVWLEEYFAP